ncbi:hypothetical protein PXW85_27325, partial [Klebsiella pneumoniae]|nr:hypothetical protein [Klebsiella pneumoniae]
MGLKILPPDINSGLNHFHVNDDGEIVYGIGAIKGVGAEERGQTEAIARNLREMSRLSVPVICTVIGEGGSGGALA